jgi:uncharacterized protein
MVRSITRLTLCAAVLLAGIAEAQVLRKIEITKLNAEDVHKLESQARRGESRAMTLLGIATAEGYGVAADPKTAVKWLSRAAKVDDIAQEYLATMLRAGKGVPTDLATARMLFAKAAAQGNRRAQFNYASMCFNGDGGQQDVDAAAKYFEIAARQGDAEAQHMIGRMYQYGRGVVQDYEQATKWYEKAAEQNYVPSIFALGLAYSDGDLGARDTAKATKYLERSAARGDWASANKLAHMYLEEGTAAANNAEAYKWLAIAHELSGMESVPSPAALEGQMKPVELSAAQQQVTEWKTLHLNAK